MAVDGRHRFRPRHLSTANCRSRRSCRPSSRSIARAEPGVVVIHSVPGFRHYNPIGSVHGGYAAILLDSAMGLAVHSHAAGGHRLHHARIQDQLHQGHDRRTPVRCAREGRTLQCRPPHRHRRSQRTTDANRPPAGACHHHLHAVRGAQDGPVGNVRRRRPLNGGYSARSRRSPCRSSPGNSEPLTFVLGTMVLCPTTRCRS